VHSRFFTGQGGSVPGVSVVNLDDPYGVKLAARLTAEVGATRVVTFGESPRAQVRAEEIALTTRGTRFRLVWPGGTMAIASPLIGGYNVSNLLAAIAAGWGLGRDPAVFLARLRAFQGVPGRMERIDAGQNFNVFVDSAHTDDALRNALTMLRGLTPGRFLVVFGCGGNRDRTRRPRMTGAVQEFADFAFATADNPRTEAIAQIFDDMRGGVIAPGRITWIDDRRRAIGLALEMAKPGDCLLIAGKGHESCQEYADTVFPFDDRQVARELIELKASRAPA
jgi:UDP-N-acetylmuramoyl-L-alanyl-D-glutamate--2,6-diaminopimelate ligase